MLATTTNDKAATDATTSKLKVKGKQRKDKGKDYVPKAFTGYNVFFRIEHFRMLQEEHKVREVDACVRWVMTKRGVPCPVDVDIDLIMI